MNWSSNVEIESDVTEHGTGQSVLFVTGIGDDPERYPPLNTLKPALDTGEWDIGVVQVKNDDEESGPEDDDDDEQKADIQGSQIEPFTLDRETVRQELDGVLNELEGPTYGIAYCLGSFYLTMDESLIDSLEGGLLLDGIPGMTTEEGRLESLAAEYPEKFVAVYDSQIPRDQRLQGLPQVEVEGTEHLHSYIPEHFDEALQDIADHVLEDGNASLEEIARSYDSLDYVHAGEGPASPGYTEAAFEYLMELFDPDIETSQPTARGFYAD